MRTFSILFLTVSLFLLTSCASMQRKLVPTVQNIPSDLRVGSKPLAVKMKMGSPSWIDTKRDGRQVWTYQDLWWEDRSWGSWRLFFNSDERLTGWEMTDPPSNQEFNRDAFFNLNKPIR